MAQNAQNDVIADLKAQLQKALAADQFELVRDLGEKLVKQEMIAKAHELKFADCLVGRRVQIKPLQEMKDLMDDEHSLWRKAFRASKRNNERLAHADKLLTITNVSKSDGTVQMNNGCWFTPDCLLTQEVVSDDEAETAAQVSVESTHSFGEHLTQHVRGVTDQMKAGSTHTAGMLKTIQTLVTLETDHAKKILSILASDSKHKSTGVYHAKEIQDDGMKSCDKAWNVTKQFFSDRAEQNLQYAKELSTAVAPIAGIIETYEKIRKSTGDTLKLQLKNLHTLLTKHKKAEANTKRILAIAMTDDADGKKGHKRTKSGFGTMKPAKARTRMPKELKAYTDTLTLSNNADQNFHATKAPQLLMRLQEMEMKRIKALETAFESLNVLIHKKYHVRQRNITVTPEKDLQEFIQGLAQTAPTNRKVVLKYILEIPEAEIKAGRFEKPKNILGSSLDQVIAKDKLEHPDVTSPLLVTKMIAIIRNNNGAEQKGIFRISVRSKDLNDACDNWDKPDFKCTDPMMAACVLKKFIRSLSDPLIPDDHYEAWRALGEQINITPDEAQQCIRSLVRALPAVNRSVIEDIAGICSDILANTDKNLMTPHNLGVVFAPTCLRNPSNDFSQVQNEVRVMSYLFQAYAGSTSSGSDHPSLTRASTSRPGHESGHHALRRVHSGVN